MSLDIARRDAQLQVERDLKFLVSRLCCSKPDGQRTCCNEASAMRSERYMQRYIQERSSCVGARHVGDSNS